MKLPWLGRFISSLYYLALWLRHIVICHFTLFLLFKEQPEGEDEIEDEAELNLEKVEEEMAADYSDEVRLIQAFNVN